MEYDTPIRGFPSLDEARGVVLKLERQGIPCCVSTDPTGVMATLFVAAEHSDQAAEIIGEDGYDILPMPEAETEEETDVEEHTSSESVLEQVSAELGTVSQKERSPVRQLGILAFSLILFFSLGLFRNSMMGVVLLVGVIFIHELGHLAGMKLLKYTDVQMFFIPFFGAAVSGTETEPRASRKAIVSLLGPVPGILIGIVTGIAYLRTRQPFFADATRTFLFINTFNLLPFHPLDGGRFFDAVLFSRNPKLEIGFKILTALVLTWLAVTFKDMFLGLFAFFVFMSLRGTYISASIAHAIRKQTDSVCDAALQPIPREWLGHIVDMLRAKLPVEQQKPKLLATYTAGIWQRIRSRPCKAFPATGLLLCYMFFIMLGIGAGFIFEMTVFALTETQTDLVYRTLPNGESVRLQVTSIRGQKFSEVQVNDKGLFDGLQVVWNIPNGDKSKEGHWKDGYWHGEWKFWDPQGKLSEIIEYDMGKPIRCVRLIDGLMKEVPPEDWPRLMKIVKQRSPEGIKQISANGVEQPAPECLPIGK